MVLFLDKDSYTYGGMNDASLVIRFITEMYNYDYIHDFVFHQNGAIELKTTLTGVLLMTPYHAKTANTDTKSRKMLWVVIMIILCCLKWI